jgi:hypothetical protein
MAEGQRLMKAHGKIQWKIGDWWSSGEHAYGERTVAAAELFDGTYSVGSLKNMASAARAFPTSRRRDLLSFAHHVTVAALPEADQERMLDLAEAEKLSVARLRSRVQDDLERQQDALEETNRTSITASLQAPTEPASDGPVDPMDYQPPRPRLKLVPDPATSPGDTEPVGGEIVPDPEPLVGCQVNVWKILSDMMKRIKNEQDTWEPLLSKTRALQLKRQLAQMSKVIERTIEQAQMESPGAER